jgi:hypothetical protein
MNSVISALEEHHLAVPALQQCEFALAAIRLWLKREDGRSDSIVVSRMEVSGCDLVSSTEC